MFRDVQRCARTPVLLAEVKTCSSRTASKYRCVMLTLSCPKRRLFFSITHAIIEYQRAAEGVGPYG